MERSRLRTLLGIALLVIGVIWLSSALARPVVHAPAMPAMPALPNLPAMPAMPKAPDMPAMPAMPAMPLPPAPPAPHAHGFGFNPAVIVLAIVGLLLWRRNRGAREQPLA